MKKLIMLGVLGMILVGCGHKKEHKVVADEPVTQVRPSPTDPLPVQPTQVSLGELTCLENSGFVSGCKFTDKVFAEKQNVLSKFSLSYDFACTGDALSLVISLDGNDLPLKQQANVTTTLYGYGPFEVKNVDPEATAEAYLKPGCKLEFKEFKVDPA